MRVKFISITKSVVEDKELSAEELLVYIARVSNPNNQLNTETADKLLGYLIKNKHWSPFDMVNMTVEVKTSKAIAIQILRHWSIKPQEFSQRYAEVTDIEPIHLRKAASSNRQSSEDRFDPIISDNYRDGKYGGQRASEVIQKYVDIGQLLYKELLSLGVAKECARMILPMATSTTMYLNGSVRSWIHYLQQRLDQHAQLEHREVAKEIKDIFQQNFPNIIKALEL
jgi:thymidylate synthase (FAD)